MTTAELEQGESGKELIVDSYKEEHHPQTYVYVAVAIFLAVVTGAEVALYYIDMAKPLLVVLLLTLAVVKFAFVALFFMHLRFDSKLFRRLFVTGIVLALIVYAIALLTLGVLVG